MSGDPDREGVDATRLARAVRITTEGAALGAAPHRERHRQTNWLRDVILGGQDGLVNILGIILGVIAGGGSNAVLVAAGFAAAITESISMGAVGYTSSVSQRDYYRAEREREETEVDTMPGAERQEIRDIYAAKGFSGELLDQVVDTITANRERWVATMMDEELHPPARSGPPVRRMPQSCPWTRTQSCPSLARVHEPGSTPPVFSTWPPSVNVRVFGFREPTTMCTSGMSPVGSHVATPGSDVSKSNSVVCVRIRLDLPSTTIG